MYEYNPIYTNKLSTPHENIPLMHNTVYQIYDYDKATDRYIAAQAQSSHSSTN
jgi:hypothetical protein